MHEIHYRLVHVWDYEMTDDLAIDGVLRSLPPSFKKYVRDYVMGKDSITFCEFVSWLRNVRVEPIAGEFDNAEGIYRYTSYKCLSPIAIVAVLQVFDTHSIL